MRIYARYETRDEHGETRRERNEKFGQEHLTPNLIIPGSFAYLWEWYFDLSSRLQRVRDGVCEPIPPTEFLAWQKLTKNVVYPREYAILGAMDAAYCDEVGKELAAFQERLKAQASETK